MGSHQQGSVVRGVRLGAEFSAVDEGYCQGQTAESAPASFGASLVSSEVVGHGEYFYCTQAWNRSQLIYQ